MMKIGVPKELTNHEYRVGLTPPGVKALTQKGHNVFVELGAGLASGISNSEYIQAGALMVDATEVWNCEMIVKVKEPLPEEFPMIKENQLILAFLHLANNEQLQRYLIAKKTTALAYECVEKKDGSLPLLLPMSEVAGRLVVMQAGTFLQKQYGGNGQLLGGVSGVESGHVVVIGAGVAGRSAVQMAVGLGAKVTVLDTDLDKLRALDDLYQGRIETISSNQTNIGKAVRNADVVISAILRSKEKSPVVVSESMVRNMKHGSVIMDISVDQGASVETIDHVTTYDHPVFEKYGVLHYAVTNIPGATPFTSTYALTNATLSYVITIADEGIEEAMKKDSALEKGVCIMQGEIRK